MPCRAGLTVGLRFSGVKKRAVPGVQVWTSVGTAKNRHRPANLAVLGVGLGEPSFGIPEPLFLSGSHYVTAGSRPFPIGLAGICAAARLAARGRVRAWRVLGASGVNARLKGNGAPAGG